MSLDQFLIEHAVSNAECARQIGTTREMVRRYRKGLARPIVGIRIDIMLWTKGAVSFTHDWPSTPE
jgi:hypothetical protein